MFAFQVVVISRFEYFVFTQTKTLAVNKYAVISFECALFSHLRLQKVFFIPCSLILFAIQHKLKLNVSHFFLCYLWSSWNVYVAVVPFFVTFLFFLQLNVFFHLEYIRWFNLCSIMFNSPHFVSVFAHNNFSENERFFPSLCTFYVTVYFTNCFRSFSHSNIALFLFQLLKEYIIKWC